MARQGAGSFSAMKTWHVKEQLYKEIWHIKEQDRAKYGTSRSRSAQNMARQGAGSFSAMKTWHVKEQLYKEIWHAKEQVNHENYKKIN
jgi:hypothetical protein